MQNSLHNLHCYHFSFNVVLSSRTTRIRHTLVKLAFLVSTILAVDLSLRLAKFLQILFAVHLFSLKRQIFLTCLVLMAYTLETAA